MVGKKVTILLMLCTIFILAIATSAAGAKANKIEICHLLKSGEFTKLTVNSKTLERHLDHGDLYPNDPIPDMEGWALDGDCIPYEIAPVFAGVLPYAYPCEPPLPGIPGPLDDLDCAVVYGDPDQNIDPIISPSDPNWDKQVLLVMDQPSFCEEISGFGSDLCDIDGDGIADLIFQAPDSRFLALLGDMNIATLDDIIRGEIAVQIYPYTWVPSIGWVIDIFSDLRFYQEGNTIPIPATDFECLGISPDIECPELYSLGNPNPPDNMILSLSSNAHYHRIIGWRYFYVSCVSYYPAHQCPLNNQVNTLLEENGFPDLNTIVTVEGYFVDN